MKTTITIELGSKSLHTAWLNAKPHTAHKLLDAVESLKLWDHGLKCWKFPRKRVDDLAAHAAERHVVYVIEVDR